MEGLDDSDLEHVGDRLESEFGADHRCDGEETLAHGRKAADPSPNHGADAGRDAVKARGYARRHALSQFGVGGEQFDELACEQRVAVRAAVHVNRKSIAISASGATTNP